jgi:hypothetical protein
VRRGHTEDRRPRVEEILDLALRAKELATHGGLAGALTFMCAVLMFWIRQHYKFLREQQRQEHANKMEVKLKPGVEVEINDRKGITRVRQRYPGENWPQEQEGVEKAKIIPLRGRSKKRPPREVPPGRTSPPGGAS